jgi:hypothetical protein
VRKLFKKRVSKKLTIKKKRRTRSHVIADLSANYVEKFALENGFSVERFRADYGYDLNIYTYDGRGEFENGFIYVQLKATDNLRINSKRATVSFQIDKRDYNLWNDEPYPVILIIFDSVKKKAYWLYFQKYFQDNTIKIKSHTKSLSLSIPTRNKVHQKSLQRFKEFKNELLNQVKKMVIVR